MSGPAATNGITVPYRIRFDECTPSGAVRTSSLLRYAQDIAWLHSERLGFGRGWYAERGLAWVVRSAELQVVAATGLGATLSLSTQVTGQRKVWARRRTEARGPDDGLVFRAHTDWVMTGRGGAPARVPPEFPAAFGVPPGGFDPVRVDVGSPPAAAYEVELRVRPQDLDPMGHVNNAAYLDYLEEVALGAGGDAAAVLGDVPRVLRIEYVLPATAGAVLRGAAWLEGGELRYRLIDADGRVLVRATLAGEAAG